MLVPRVNVPGGKRIRLLDAALLLALLAVAAGLLVRACHPDRVASWLTDLSRRENVTVVVAVPNPWLRPPLSALPSSGDSEVGTGGRDLAVFRALAGETLPAALFHVRARVDEEGRRWFNYVEVIPGSNFYFRTDRYRMEGLVLDVRPGWIENPPAPAPSPG